MKSLMNDLCVIAGGASITYGAWLLSPALAWLLAGLAMTALGVAGAHTQRRKDKQP